MTKDCSVYAALYTDFHKENENGRTKAYVKKKLHVRLLSKVGNLSKNEPITIMKKKKKRRNFDD